jgi:hypothetical protein
VLASALLVIGFAPVAHAQISDDVVKIGVLNDQSGLDADLGGPGSVVAAKMAVADFGDTVLGKRIEVISGDHQNKHLAQVKMPSESKGPWDYYKILATIPGDQAFRPLAEGGCPLVR